MSWRGRGFARDQRSHPSPSNSNTRQRGSSHSQHATSLRDQALRPPELSSEGLPQAEDGFQMVHRRGRGGHRGTSAQSYRGQGGRRDPRTEHHGDSREGAESGAAFPEVSYHGRTTEDSRRSERGSFHSQHAKSLRVQALQPPELLSEGLSQADDAFQMVHRRGRGGHRGTSAQSYRGQGGRRDPRTEHHGDSREGAESGAAFPEVSYHGRTTEDSRRSERGSFHSQHATSLRVQALQPPELSSEGLPQAEDGFQMVHHRGRGGHRGTSAQSYRGRGGRRDPRTEHRGDSREGAESSAAFSKVSYYGRTTEDSRRSDVPEQSDTDWRLSKSSGMGRRQSQEASLSSALVQSEAANPSSTSSGDVSKTFTPQKGDRFSVTPHSSSGTKGRPLLVKANFFAIESFNKNIAFHYDVSFNPDKPKKMLRLVFEEIKKIYFPDNVIAFDGVKNAYTMIPLAGGKNEIIQHKVKIQNKDKNRDIEFKVAIKLVARVDLALVDQKCIQILEVVLRSIAAVKYTSVGRSFFSLDNPSIPLMDGLVIRSGLHFSVRQGSDKLYVNFDSIHKAFLKGQPVVDTIKEILGSYSRPPSLESQIYQLRNILKGVKVKYSMPAGSKYVTRIYTVTDVSEPPAKIKFEFQGSSITVEDYFKNEKQYELKNRHLPCLKLGSSAYVPAELCSIVEGQVIQKHLSAKQSDAMIEQAAIDPCERAKKIQAECEYLDLQNSPLAKEFEIVVNSKFQPIKAHVLDAPKLIYNESLVSPKNGGWYPDSSFIQGAALKKWTIFILNRCIYQEDADKFVKLLMEEGNKMGLTIDQPYRYRELDPRPGAGVHFFQKELSSCSGYDLVIVIGNKNKDLYTNLKTAADLKLGICTQFITSAVLKRQKNYAKIIHNIIQKLNAKLGGVNHMLQSVVPAKFSNASIMYVGADVTHPAVGETGSPSVAAVCASQDASGFQYNGQISIQPPKKEIINDLERIMFHLLKAYKGNVGKKPDIILFFRDGVGEGQFTDVISKEVKAIQKACAEFESDYKPKITFLVVQKRHHARFFPNEQITGRNKNVPPGTVVDNTITNPKDCEFYLVSHNSPRGCSRPCRYHCVWDDNKLSEDELHEMAYYQCYTYARCEQSISYPTPTYYAHHAAARGKLYLLGEKHQGYSNQIIERHSDNLQKLPGMNFI